MRVKSRWFNSERPKTLGEIAGAGAFIVWRIAQQALVNMRRADFEIHPGPKYFDFLSEWLVFLIQIADRIVYERIGAQRRFEFTSALANRVGEILADNRDDLLGAAPGAHRGDSSKTAFIDLLNLRSIDYADFRFDGTTTDFGFRRYLADQLTHAVGERDSVWVHDQVMEIEVLQAVDLVRKAMANLFDDAPAPGGRSGTRGAALGGD